MKHPLGTRGRDENRKQEKDSAASQLENLWSPADINNITVGINGNRLLLKTFLDGMVTHEDFVKFLKLKGGQKG